MTNEQLDALEKRAQDYRPYNSMNDMPLISDLRTAVRSLRAQLAEKDSVLKNAKDLLETLEAMETEEDARDEIIAVIKSITKLLED